MPASVARIESHPPPAAATAAEFALSPDVIFLTVEDGSARLIDMGRSFHALPRIGARMLRETLVSGPALAAVRIAEAYGVAREQVESDLGAFLRELESHGLLRRAGSRRRDVRLRLARRLLRPAIHAAHRYLRSPETQARALLGLARLSFATFGWTPTVAAWREAHAHLAVRQVGDGDAQIIAALDRTVRAAAARLPVAVACKERALTAWSLAKAAGLDAAIVVGVELFPIAGHCWCEVGPHTPGDERERCDRFTPVGRW